MATITVTFDDGSTYTLDEDDLVGTDGLGYSEVITVDGEEFDSRFVGYMWAFLRHGQALFRGFSTSSVAIGTGTKNFTITTYRPFFAPMRVRIVDAGNAANYMLATVVSYDADTGAFEVSVAVGDTGGSGTIDDWVIYGIGEKGETGDPGDVTGPVSSTDHAWPRWSGVDGDEIQDGQWVEDDSGNVTAGGTLNGADNTLTRVNLLDYGEKVNALGSIGGGTQDIDLTLGNVVTGTVDTSETTFTFSNPTATGDACSFTFIVTNGGSQTINWPASVDWPEATAPTLTASGVDILVFVTLDAGTTWRGAVAGLAFA
jgi:hypothetical protein